MFPVKTLFLFAGLTLSQALDHCSGNVLQLNTQSSWKESSNEGAKLTDVNMMKSSTNYSAKIFFIESERRFRYCTAKIEKDESELCSQKTIGTVYSEEDALDCFSKRKCKVGVTCNEYDCKGEKSGFCLEPTLIEFINARKLRELNKATSLFRHTCVQIWSCNIREAEVNLILKDTGNIMIFDPIFGSFEFPKGQRISYSNQRRSKVAILPQIAQINTIPIVSKCIEQGERSVCVDLETNTIFTRSPKSTICVKNHCFSESEVSKEDASNNKYDDVGTLATRSDVESNHKFLQYLNIQTNYDLGVVSHRLSQVEKLIQRIILWDATSKGGLVSSIMGRKVEIQKVHEGIISIKGCRQSFGEESNYTSVFSPKGNALVATNRTGFEQSSFFSEGHMESYLIPDLNFTVDALTYNDISKLEIDEGELEIGNKSGKGPFFGFPSLIEMIWEFVIKAGSVSGLVLGLRKLFGSRCR